MRSSAPGRVTCFYGFKGGSGRSFTLAQVAWLLASLGKKVLVIDGDLEAPGLGDFFGDLNKQARFDLTWRKSQGFLDLIGEIEVVGEEDVRRTLDRRKRDKKDRVIHRVPLKRDQVIDFLGPGRMHFGPVPSGNDTKDNYANTLLNADWSAFYRFGGRNLVRIMLSCWREEYDHILFDMRTGYNQNSAAITTVVADNLVLFAVPSIQSIVGLNDMNDSLRAGRNEIAQDLGIEGFRAATVLCRVEAGQGGADATYLFEKYFARLAPSQGDEQPQMITMPYVPGLQQERIITEFGDGEGPLREPLRQLVEFIQDAPATGADLDVMFPPAKTLVAPSPPDVKSQFPIGNPAKELFNTIEKALDPKAALPHEYNQAPRTTTNEEMLLTNFKAQYSKFTYIQMILFDLEVSTHPKQREICELLGIGHRGGEAQAAQDGAEDSMRPRNVQPHGGLSEEGETDNPVRRLQEAAFNDDRQAFYAALEDIRSRSLNRRSAKEDWEVGYLWTDAAGVLRDLGGVYLPEAEKLFRRGWQAGALLSEGKPPPPNEASGLISYAFLLANMGLARIGRRTLDRLKDAVQAADSAQRASKPAEHSLHWVYSNILDHATWWDAALAMTDAPRHGPKPDMTIGTTTPLANICSAGLVPENAALNAWWAEAFRLRGEERMARDFAKAAYDAAITHYGRHDDRRLGEPAAYTVARTGLAFAEAALLRGETPDAGSALDAIELPRSTELYEDRLPFFALRKALLRALIDPDGLEGVIALARRIVGESPVSSDYCATPTDGLLRCATIVRAVLASSRLGRGPDAPMIEWCEELLPKIEVLNPTTAAELAYLLECAKAGKPLPTERGAGLLAAKLIAGSDKAVEETACAGLERRAALWISGPESIQAGSA